MVQLDSYLGQFGYGLLAMHFLSDYDVSADWLRNSEASVASLPLRRSTFQPRWLISHLWLAIVRRMVVWDSDGKLCQFLALFWAYTMFPAIQFVAGTLG